MTSSSKQFNTKSYKLLTFQDFPPILGQPIILDKNTIFYRAYDIKYDQLNRPAFFGEYSTAIKYKTNERVISAFVTKRAIKVLDIRYVSHIINQLILLRENNDFDKMIIGYMTLALSFGFVSLQEQIELYKKRYRERLQNDKRFEKIIQYYNDYKKAKETSSTFTWQNPIELQGIRIGETMNDIESTIILKEIFGEYFDGIIYPTTFSPYFITNHIDNELLLFEPSKCVLENKKNILLLNTNSAVNIDILDVIKKNGINIFQVPYLMKNHKYLYFQYGGGSNWQHDLNYIFEKNNSLHTYYDTHKKKVKKLKKIGKMFKNELFDQKKDISKEINYINEKNDLIASRQNMIFDPSGWKK